MQIRKKRKSEGDERRSSGWTEELSIKNCDAPNILIMEKKIAFALVYILLFPALLLFLSGDYAWPEGWIFSLWLLLLCYSVILYLYRKDPALLEERYRSPGTGNEEAWDRFIVYGLFIGFMIWIIIMPLDAKWFSWSPAFPLYLKALGGVGLIVAFVLFFRSYADNPYLSPLVRVQKEREHQVVSTGVYRFVRHPMYLGAIIMFFSAPLLLGSIGGVIVACAMMILLMARILGEEAFLARELDGYPEYMAKVPYRLLPFVW